MDNLQELQTMFRVQASEVNLSPHTHKDYPVKRVLISGAGKIDFNPDSNQYVYFSRTDRHHVYYIFNKVFKIVADEINRLDMARFFVRGKDHLSVSDFYNNMDRAVLRQVKNFLRDYLPPSCVELVALTYLDSFKKFFVSCANKNMRKRGGNVPEIADAHNYGGAFGVNDAWLELLKTCTTQSSLSTLYLDDFFDFVIANQLRFVSVRKTLKSFIAQNEHYFNMLDEFVQWHTTANPDFYHKDNINNMRRAVVEIDKKQLYNDELHLSRHDFQSIKRAIKEDIEQNR